MKSYEKAAELLRRGFILTSEKCLRCGYVLFKNPKTGKTVCPFCKYEEKEVDILSLKESEILEKIKSEKSAKELYFLLKSLLMIKKLKKLTKDDEVDRDKRSKV